MWRCGNCNFTLQGEEAPDKCPKCGAPKEKFVKLEADHVEKIERSRYGNTLLMELNSMMEALAEMSEAGIEDDLDPPCVKLWQECLDFSAFARQSLKAEIQNHIGKGKWG